MSRFRSSVVDIVVKKIIWNAFSSSPVSNNVIFIGSDFTNLFETALALIFSDILSVLRNGYTFLIDFYGMRGLRLASNIIARWSDIPGTARMFSIRFGVEVI